MHRYFNVLQYRIVHYSKAQNYDVKEYFSDLSYRSASEHKELLFPLSKTHKTTKEPFE